MADFEGELSRPLTPQQVYMAIDLDLIISKRLSEELVSTDPDSKTMNFLLGRVSALNVSLMLLKQMEQ